MDERKLCLLISERMPRGDLFTGAKRWIHPESNAPWRISPEPFWLSRDEVEWFERLGDHPLQWGQYTPSFHLIFLIMSAMISSTSLMRLIIDSGILMGCLLMKGFHHLMSIPFPPTMCANKSQLLNLKRYTPRSSIRQTESA